MVLYNFQVNNGMPVAPTDIVRVALKKAQLQQPKEFQHESNISRIRMVFVKKLNHVETCINELLDEILDEFPVTVIKSPFYSIMIEQLTDESFLKISFDQLAAVKAGISKSAKEFKQTLKFSQSLTSCKDLLRNGVQKMCALVLNLKASMGYLKELREHMQLFPSLDPNTRTVLLAGYPNVGKSTFMQAVSSPETVKAQPFFSTTKALMMGDMDFNYLRWQVVNTAGILDHTTDIIDESTENNYFERQSITALGKLKCCVLYFLDISEQCGHTLDTQLKLFESICSKFSEQSCVLVISKADKVSLDEISEDKKALIQNTASLAGVDMFLLNNLWAESVEELKKTACNLVLKAQADAKLDPSTQRNLQARDSDIKHAGYFPCDPFKHYVAEEDKWITPPSSFVLNNADWNSINALIDALLMESATNENHSEECNEVDSAEVEAVADEHSLANETAGRKVESFPTWLIPEPQGAAKPIITDRRTTNVSSSPPVTPVNDSPPSSSLFECIASFQCWDIEARCGLLLSFIAGISLLADAVWVVRAAIWLSLLQAVYSICVSAPALRIDIHWRSLPQYLFVLTLSVLCIIDIIIEYASSRDDIFSFSVRVGYGVTHLVVNLLTCVTYYYLPLPDRCLLVGKYKKIGTTSFVIPHSDEMGASTPSTITIQCWFPIRSDCVATEGFVAGKSTALLWTSGEPLHQFQESIDMMDTLAHNNKMPSFSVKHLCMARTNSIWQNTLNQLAPLTGGKRHPIAVYSHGLWGWRQIHHSACENLASTGVVVFACDHTPDSMCSRPLRMPHQRFDFPTPPGLSLEEERKFFQGGMERRVAQVSSIITHIQSEQFQQDHVVVGKLDYSQIHLWGHSYGGGTISTLCCRDNPFKIRSATMLDGWIYPVPDPDRKRGFQTASLLNLSAERWPYGKYQFPFRADLVKNSHVSPAPLDLVLRGADHQNFVDIYMIARQSLLERPSMLGKTLNSGQAIAVLDQLLPAYIWGLASLSHSKSDDKSTVESADVQLTLSEPGVASVDDLLAICTQQSSPSPLSTAAADFIRKNVYHATQLPEEYIDYKAYNRVIKEKEHSEQK